MCVACDAAIRRLGFFSAMRLQLCRFFNITFRKRFLMHFFLREFILYRLSLAFSDLNHDIAFEN